jgi:hypothetical protein
LFELGDGEGVFGVMVLRWGFFERFVRTSTIVRKLPLHCPFFHGGVVCVHGELLSEAYHQVLGNDALTI